MEENKPIIKELLLQLLVAIEASFDLSIEDKKEALKQVLVLAVAGTNPTEARMQKVAKTAIKILKGTVTELSLANQLVEKFNKLPSAIAKSFSLG